MLYTPFSTVQRVPAPPIVWEKTDSEAIDGIVLGNLKTWINRPLEDDFWNNEATSLIIVAQRAIERYCHLSIAPSTWVGTMPYILTQQVLDRRPFLSVEKIEVVSPVDGTVSDVPASSYQAARVGQMCGQAWIDENDWPDVATRQDAVRVTVKTGWPIKDAKPVMPDDLMHGILMMVASLDMHRGDEGTGGGHLANTVYGQTHSTGPMVIPPGVQALLAPFRYAALYTA